jgi:hypothetical protein
MKTLSLMAIWLVCILCACIALPWMLVAVFTHSPRFMQMAYAFDRVGNAVTGGSADEYLSSRANRAQKEGRRWGCILCRLLDKVDPGHCRKYDTPPAA